MSQDATKAKFIRFIYAFGIEKTHTLEIIVILLFTFCWLWREIATCVGGWRWMRGFLHQGWRSQKMRWFFICCEMRRWKELKRRILFCWDFFQLRSSCMVLDDNVHRLMVKGFFLLLILQTDRDISFRLQSFRVPEVPRFSFPLSLSMLM